MNNKTALNCKTHYSLLRGFSKCEILAKKCSEYGYTSCILSDIKTIAGAIDFHKACKKHDIKPIIGCDFEQYMLVAKNKNGWLDLIKYFSDQSLTNLKTVSKNGNILCLSLNNSFKKLFQKNFIEIDYHKYASYYVEKDDAVLHRILLCSGMKKTIPQVNKMIKNNEEFDDKMFFMSDEFYLKKQQDIDFDIGELCEDYEITHKPILPEFKCPDSLSQDEYLTQLCRIGWREKLINNGVLENEDIKSKYTNRIKLELDVIFEAGLSGYFLIVQDIVNEVKRRGWIAGVGRGSAAGSLVSYLIGITGIDPIKYNLLWERFYNRGRDSGDHISLPDIDMDVPADKRDDIIEYIKNKYGHDKVSQMITFGRLQGRAALKEVLRISDAVSFAEMNEITKNIPNEAEISDQLELMEQKSIIRWALENQPESLEGWCKINNNGELVGPLSEIFDRAIKIEGTNKSQGKHAAGVIISKERLKDVCPMIKDKNGQIIAGFEMNDLESQGHVKFDVLGIDLLGKVMEIINYESD